MASYQFKCCYDMSETDVVVMQIVTGNIVDRNEGGDSSGISKN